MFAIERVWMVFSNLLLMTTFPILEEIGKTFSEWYDMGYANSRQLLKYPHEIITFIESCNFDCEQLQRIMVWIEWIKWSDYEDTRIDDFDTYDARRDAELEML